MSIKYIEGFAGIGGFRLGFEQACAELGIEPECAFAFEKDKFAKQTYLANFGEEPAGDITKIPSKDIPGRKSKDDILFFFAGLPCQPWSTAGKQLGVNDERNMIPQVTRIILDKQPDVFILENVKGLKSKKFKDVYDRLMWDLKVICGYTVYERIYNAKAVVPQNRERIFIVGFKNQIDFEFPELPPLYPVLKDVLEFKDVPEKYFLKEKTWQYLQKKQSNKKYGFGFNIANIAGYTNTLPARYGNDGYDILVPEISRWNPYHRIAGLDEQANTITAQYGSNGGAATLIPELRKIGNISKSQTKRIYDINGISPTLCSGGEGHLGGWNGFLMFQNLNK
jgi:DNA (cytosine-5)-methyltransferase 1